MDVASVADRSRAIARILIPNMIGVVERYNIMVDVVIRIKYIIKITYNEKIWT